VVNSLFDGASTHRTIYPLLDARPYQYGNHKKLNLKEGTVTATFKNVPKGTWVVGMHAFNRTSEDGKKVFSPWSNLKKATVK
jgi:hypothetical protein